MAGSFRQWESDPLFSAAEVVQDSADRMESIYRNLLHEQSLVEAESTTDEKLLTSLDYHRRDLATALGTTKWQLEDFERAVTLSASNVREDVLSRHRHFIRAIQDQVFQVSQRNTHLINLNEKDQDGLALFLSAGNPVDPLTEYDSDSSVMRRFLDSTKPSGFNDEIIELRTEEIEDPRENGVMHIDHSFDNIKENKLRKVASNYFTRPGFETVISIEDSSKNTQGGSWELENPDSNAKNIFSKNKLRGSRSRLDVFSFLGNMWYAYGDKMAKSFAKRRKDGEVIGDFDQNPSSSYADILQAEQGTYSWMGFSSVPSSWFGYYKRLYLRLQLQFNRSPLPLTSLLILILMILGMLLFILV